MELKCLKCGNAIEIIAEQYEYRTIDSLKETYLNGRKDMLQDVHKKIEKLVLQWELTGTLFATVHALSEQLKTIKIESVGP